MSETTTGSCSCGAVKFEVTLPAKWCANCHCSMCRRAHSAPYVTWVGLVTSAFRFVAGEDRVVRHASSPEARRSFCAVCGSQVTFEATRWPGEVHVARACLPDALELSPKAHAFWSDRAPWVDLHDDLPKFGGSSGTEKL
jgi:hypothetical protein